VFGVPNWLFWGALMIITAFIPVLGTPIVWVPAAVGLLLDGDTGRGVGLLIFGSTIVMNIDNVLRPRLMSGRSKVHPVMILIGVLGGLKIFGFVGMLVGPLILALLVAFIKFYEQAYPHPKVMGPAAD
jgi:predicted PurR-regulated permease PerM